MPYSIFLGIHNLSLDDTLQLLNLNRTQYTREKGPGAYHGGRTLFTHVDRVSWGEDYQPQGGVLYCYERVTHRDFTFETWEDSYSWHSSGFPPSEMFELARKIEARYGRH